jgi:NADH-quinone oxidoreductase subunit B
MGDVTRSLTLEGSEQGFATTRVDALLGWARKYSLFSYPFVTACCAMEFMAVPKWVHAFGTCAASGGFYDNYTTLPGIDKVVPTDIYIPGCPPRPEAVLDGLMLLQDKIARGDNRPGVVKPRFDPVQEAAALVQLRRSAKDPRDLLPAIKKEESAGPHASHRESK